MMEVQQRLDTIDPASLKRLELVEIEGVSLPDTIVEQWDAISGFKARPDDLLISTYPKAGTTWMQEIVDMIHHGGDPQKCARAPIYERIPFIEMCPPKPIRTGFEEAEAMPSPRTLKTHLPVHLLPSSFWEQNCKIIYVARNIKDNAVSYFHFHHMSKLMPEAGNWDEFLENFIAGKVAWGSWFDHVRGWWEAKNHHPILYVFYEDIKKDPAREIQKVAQFLGLELSEAVLGDIVQHTKFETMKTNPMTNYTTMPSFLLDQDITQFMRKGTVGDWKEHFTVAQSEQLDDLCARLLAGNGLTFHTQL
ncbi:sulfotransferase 1C2-like [Python bivittatus]|uniref:Sulfotransferase n=1 Tax=Python bivittatus TaxID=176946 RepID=A0A9F2N3K6_PYTBI|nr:sulfotransferase 1C2-like [Python bivittatus]